MSNPQLSIIIANFNKEAFIASTLRSALEQGEGVQVVVVDDASKDNSVEIIAAMADADPRIELVRLTENRGQSHCENRGLERATGKYVIYLDSDDMLASGCGPRRIEVAEREPDFDLWIFPMATFTTDPQVTKRGWIPHDTDHLRNVLAHKLDWQLMQPLWRADFLRSFGAFDESFKRMTDVVLHTRALLAGARIRTFPDLPADCYYRIDDSRLTFSADQLARRRVAAAIQYQQTFQPLVPPSYRRALGGTLLANMYWVLHQRRLGRVAPDLADQLCRELIAACPQRDQRVVLNGYRIAATHSPRHIPGLAWMARKLIGV